MVLFKFKGKFYRGKVQGIYSQGVEIAFVDYGYVEFVDPNDIYEWHPRWDVIPGSSIVFNELTSDLKHTFELGLEKPTVIFFHILIILFFLLLSEMVFQCSLNGLALYDANDENAIKVFRQLILGQTGLKVRIV